MIEDGPIKMLMHEHEIILKVMNALEHVADAMKRGRKVDAELLRGAVQFMREFADRFHHSKEEDLLFPALQRKGVPEHGGPIGVMKNEHELARTLVASFEETVEAYAEQGERAVDALCAAIHNIAALYPDHIWKEDNVLYPMAVELFTSEEMNELLHQFEDVEAEIGLAAHSDLVNFADRLELESARG